MKRSSTKDDVFVDVIRMMIWRRTDDCIEARVHVVVMGA